MTTHSDSEVSADADSPGVPYNELSEIVVEPEDLNLASVIAKYRSDRCPASWPIKIDSHDNLSREEAWQKFRTAAAEWYRLMQRTQVSDSPPIQSRVICRANAMIDGVPETLVGTVTHKEGPSICVAVPSQPSTISTTSEDVKSELQDVKTELKDVKTELKDELKDVKELGTP